MEVQAVLVLAVVLALEVDIHGMVQNVSFGGSDGFQPKFVGETELPEINGHFQDVVEFFGISSIDLGVDFDMSALFLLFAVRVQESEVFVGDLEFGVDSLVTNTCVERYLRKKLEIR